MNPSTTEVEALKDEWTDQFVRVTGNRPELAHFDSMVGKVITVNFDGKAIIDFADGAWYDISASSRFLEKVSAEDAKGKYDPKATSAQPVPDRQS